jgi:Ca2+-transporting ATPase
MTGSTALARREAEPGARLARHRGVLDARSDTTPTHDLPGNDEGLTEREARDRLGRDGPNELASKPPTPHWRRFVAQFRSVLVLLLLAATGISLVLWVHERDTALPYDAIAILAIVLLNAALGYVQELRAESAVAALRAMSAPEATVIRDGERRRIPARDVVGGDVILIEEGDTIAADARLLRVAALRVAEAPLTGESVPVGKSLASVAADAALADRTDMVFSGTTAVSGRGRARVVGIGMNTEIGRIAGMLDAVQTEDTPLQRELDRLGRTLGALVVVVALVVVAAIYALEPAHGVAAIVNVLLLGVALAVAAVPEGLPAIVTAVLAIGVRRMARRSAIVRRLTAVETLGSATVIASDKTGTLTTNAMTVRVVRTASGRAAPADLSRVGGEQRVELERTLVAASLANNASLRRGAGDDWEVQGDPTEGALLLAAQAAGVDVHALEARWPRLAEQPFTSERKRMSTVHEAADDADVRMLFAKGAPDLLLRRCACELVGERTVPLTDERRDAVLREAESLADDALRTLAVAYRTLDGDVGANAGDADAADAADAGDAGDALERELVLLGLVGMIDPPRPEASDAVRRARAAGIRPLLITGDHPRTAVVIARELGIADDDRVVTGAELEEMDDDALARAVRETSVFARVDPSHKLRLVRALQSQGEVVAMTGDGVNDAPALRAADIGIAMGISGTDVSRQAADMVLADDNFATIVAAVEEGRAIYANIRRALRFLLSGNFGEVTTMFVGVALAGTLGLREADGGLLLPLLATQILWINLLTDGAPALALGVDPAEPGLMQMKPRRRDEPVIAPHTWRDIAIAGVIMAASTLFVFDASLPGGLLAGASDVPHARTMAFTTIVLAQLFNVFDSRSRRRSAFSGLAHTKWTWAAVLASVALQALVVYMPPLRAAFGTTPLNATDWLLCAAAASVLLWVHEITKLVARRRDGTRRASR